MIRALAAVTVIAMEALAIYTVSELFAGGYAEQGAVPALLLVLVALTAFGLITLADELDLDTLPAALLVATVAFVAIYGSLRITFAGDFALWNFGWIGAFLDDPSAILRDHVAALPGVIVLLLAWVRGASRANEEIELELVPRMVGVPFLVVTTVMILAAPSDRAGEVVRGGAAFYAVAVLALAFSQLAMSGATFGDLRAGGVTASLLGGTVAVTVVSVAIVTVVLGFFADTFGAFIGHAVETILTIVLTPPAWLIQKIVGLLFSDLDFTRANENLREQIDASPDPTGSHRSPIEMVALFGMRVLALLVALGVVALIIAWFSRVRRRQRAREEEPTRAASAGSFAEDAGAFFRGLFRRQPRSQVLGDSPAERLYYRALAEAERAGQPRQPGETPEEFAPRMRDALHTPVTDDITAAFEAARYAGRPPDPATVAELERRWRQSAR